MQKLARDRFRKHQHGQFKDGAKKMDNEARFCERIAAGGKNGWDREFSAVYGLAGAVIERTIDKWIGPGKARL